MAAFIRSNLKYPSRALEAKIQGRVAVDIDIDKNGKVQKAKIRSGLGHGCDEEALRVAKLLKFLPTKNKKLRVVFHKTIYVNFALPKPVQMSYNYQVSSNKQSNSKQNQGSGSYSYSIKIRKDQ